MGASQSALRGSETFGVAIDIGTTTIAAYLVRLGIAGDDPIIVASASRLNGQRVFGTDDLSRIEYSMRTDRGIDEMKRLVRTDIRSLIDELLAGSPAQNEALRKIAVTGSETMLRLFEGRRPVGGLQEAASGRSIDAVEFDLPYPRCNVIRAPSLAVGADLLTAIRTAGLAESDELTLLIDLGSKGAVALGDRHGITCYATAEGPPFEGTSLSYGTGGVPGAVAGLEWRKGRLRWTTIGDAEAVGLCASGVLDAAACLVRASIVDASGALGERWWSSGYPLVKSGSADLRFTQADVRLVQMAKAAVAAGTAMVLADRGIDQNEVHRVLLSGSFGGMPSTASAAVIGLLPASLLDRASSIGNASGLGAVRLLGREDERERLEDLAQGCKVIDSSARGFDERFARELLFPSADAVLEAVVPAD